MENKTKKKGLVSTCIILVIALVMATVTGISFSKKRNFVEDIVVGSNVTGTFKLDEYNENLKGTVGDVDVYVLKGEEAGGSVLILGGTHANEPAGHMAAILILEQFQVSKGTVYVIPNICQSGLTHNDPLEGTPQYLHFTTKNGEMRTFHFGSRASNPIDQWPDPDTYLHTSGDWTSDKIKEGVKTTQTLSGSEVRNQNRCYPGIADGTVTECVSYAVTNMINTLKIDMVIDLHESSPEYAVNNAIVAHQDALSMAADTKLELDGIDISIRVEPSPAGLRGLTHRELGDYTDAYALLCEVGNPSQGRFRGYTDETLAISGKDPCYAAAYAINDGKLLYVDYSSGDFPLALRVARHVATCAQLILSMNFEIDDAAREVIVDNFEDADMIDEFYNDLVEADDLGLWLN